MRYRLTITPGSLVPGMRWTWRLWLPTSRPEGHTIAYGSTYTRWGARRDARLTARLVDEWDECIHRQVTP